ncbi:hypothetical protein [Nostocoides sp. HKS02]|uniref:hypothetical protein n=1 Tax=Nostocoides sp. HKS02 TaxID=1813880 RepID=UPI0012B4F203|nr:hypothetical protein [Tetrasphaera sp. HKS02]QGN58396.1 hypothetical protein GKE56_11445 [Tetrasphaera sp. HKS02]
MTRRRARRALALVGVIAAVSAVATLAYRHAYGTWWQEPERISFCGRTYLAGHSDLTLTDVQRFERTTSLAGDKPYPLVSIGKTPPLVGQAMLAALTPESRQRQLGVPCTMGLYLQTGADSYTAYGLSGGP